MAYSIIGNKAIPDIDGSVFIRGMTTGNNLLDGGFSNQSHGINLEVEPGVLSFTVSPTSASTNLTGNMLSYTPNDTTLSGQDMFFLARDSATQDGSYYHWNGTTLTLKRTDSTNNYNFGKSYIATYRNEIYTTSRLIP